jgi:hypothetical protein
MVIFFASAGPGRCCCGQRGRRSPETPPQMGHQPLMNALHRHHISVVAGARAQGDVHKVCRPTIAGALATPGAPACTARGVYNGLPLRAGLWRHRLVRRAIGWT